MQISKESLVWLIEWEHMPQTAGATEMTGPSSIIQIKIKSTVDVTDGSNRCELVLVDFESCQTI